MTDRDHHNEIDIETQADSDWPDDFGEMLNLLIEHGFEGMAWAMQTLLNEAMKIERSQVLAAQPYQRTPQRRIGANGFASSPRPSTRAWAPWSWPCPKRAAWTSTPLLPLFAGTGDA
jgi:hypothetical protein